MTCLVPTCLPSHSRIVPRLPYPQVLRLQALLDASSRIRNTLCVLFTLGFGAYMALNNQVGGWLGG